MGAFRQMRMDIVVQAGIIPILMLAGANHRVAVAQKAVHDEFATATMAALHLASLVDVKGARIEPDVAVDMAPLPHLDVP